jgi:hypothetical protein
MNFPLKPNVAGKLFSSHEKFMDRTARYRNIKLHQKIICSLLVVACPFATASAQASFFSQQSSPPSQQSSPAQSQPPSQAQSTTPAQPPQKEDSLAEAARKAKEKKPATAKGKVYTEDDISGLKGPGVSVVGEAPKKGARPSRPMDQDGGQNNEAYWRGRAREILDQLTAVDQEIAQKKDEIKKYGTGGFDVTTGMKENIAYINDRNGQVKSLEKRKADLAKQLDDLQEEGRKAGAAPSWFR